MKKPIIVAIILTVLLSCTDTKIKSQQELKTGIDFYLKGKYDSSIVYCDKAIKLDSSNSEAYYYLSKVNFKIDNYSEALKLVDIAESKKYKIDSTAYLRLEILFAQENYDEYIINCDELIRRNTSNYKIYCKKSTALFNKSVNEEDTDEQVKYLKEALDNVNIALNLNKSDNETFVLRGAIRYALADYKGAIKDLSLAIVAEKKDSSILSLAYRYKGLTERDLGNLAISETLLDSAIIFKKDNALSYLNRGDIKIGLSKLKGACEDYRKSLELGENMAVDRIRMYCK